MFQSPITRFVVGAPIAAGVVYGLLSFMGTAIAAEYVKPDSIERPPLIPVTPPPEELPTPEPRPDLIDPDMVASPPPDLPPLSSPDMGDPKVLWVPISDPSAGLPEGDLRDVGAGPAVMPERSPKAIMVPSPVMPNRALAQGISGTCDVRFSLTAAGAPFDVVASCSNDVFEREASRAVERARFVPEIRDGQQVESYNLVYPLEFVVSD